MTPQDKAAAEYAEIYQEPGYAQTKDEWQFTISEAFNSGATWHKSTVEPVLREVLDVQTCELGHLQLIKNPSTNDTDRMNDLQQSITNLKNIMDGNG